MADSNWQKGNYEIENLPMKGLSVARIAHITYLSKKGLQEKFEENYKKEIT